MPIVFAKCTNCGANLEVENTKDAAICPYCGTPYIVEKAINNYNVTNHINAETVNVFGGNSPDFQIRAGELIKYNGAATEVVIPNSVKIIGGSAFSGCQALKSVKIPNGVTRIGREAFSGCSSLSSVTIPDSVTGIDQRAFYCCSDLTSITIPGSVTSIGEEAFVGCDSLTSVTIPGSIKSMGRFAFRHCNSLTNVTFLDGITNIDEMAFCDCISLIKLSLPDSVSSIGNIAFRGCTSLTSVMIPGSVKSIGQYAFSDCISLTSVTILDGVTRIDVRAFEGCSSLTSVNIPSSVTRIEYDAFKNCGIKTIEIQGNPEIGSSTFDRTIETIIASSEWKEKYKDYFDCLKQNKSNPGCYIATAVYGSYDCPEVWTLRRYRDYVLASSWYGRLFISFYYAVSPTLVRWFGETEWFRKLWKPRLDKLAARLNREGFEDSPYQDKTV
ncbi:MAG: leucine-rich repeat protein [Oscillospiraceae bacterium]|nr:leucine-rich repeat protein [Oscillospiraceae bacterium]